MVDIVVDGEVNDEYMRTLEILSKKLKFVEVDPMVKASKALKDVQPKLEKVRQKAVSKVFDFIVQKLYALRKPKTNIQILQQSVLLKYKVKWERKVAKDKQSVKFAPGSVVLRLLCPASKTGGVIGKGGNIISEIRQETGAKVRVEETVPGCDERVVVISGSDKEIEVTTEASREDGGEETNMDEKNDDEKEQNENNEDKESDAVGDAKSDKGTSAVQKALFLVFERIIEGELETDGGDEDDNKSSSIVFRLLVLSNQVGCLLGKGGSVIKQMSAESGAQIRILPRDKLPPCASAADELV